MLAKMNEKKQLNFQICMEKNNFLSIKIYSVFYNTYSCVEKLPQAIFYTRRGCKNYSALRKKVWDWKKKCGKHWQRYTQCGTFNVHLCKALKSAIGLIPLEWIFFALSKAFYGAEFNEAFTLHPISTKKGYCIHCWWCSLPFHEQSCVPLKPFVTLIR